MTVRELHGWSPKSLTLNADGSVASVTVTQARFTPREVALLLASRRSEHAPRSSTGILLADATDPAKSDAFVVPLPTTDFAAKALRIAQRKYEQRWGEESLDDTLWRVEEKD